MRFFRKTILSTAVLFAIPSLSTACSLSNNLLKVTCEHCSYSMDKIIVKPHDEVVVTFNNIESNYILPWGKDESFFKVTGADSYNYNVEEKSVSIVVGETTVKVFCKAIGVNDVNEYGFREGDGSEDNPFVVANADELSNINNCYGPETKYYEIPSDINEIDCTNFVDTGVKFNGVFNGNGVTLNNLHSVLFSNLGYIEDEEGEVKWYDTNVTIKNVTCNVDMTSANPSLAKEIDNIGVTTFDNVSVHGLIFATGSFASSFCGFGTRNHDDTHGHNYTIAFNDCHSDATIVSPEFASGFISHTYCGGGNTSNIIIKNSSYNGYMFVNKPNSAKKYFGMGDANIKLTIDDGEPIEGAWTDKKFIDANSYDNVTQVSLENPSKDDSGEYVVTKSSGATKCMFSICGQLTGYNPDDTVAAGGITFTFATKIINNLDETIPLLGKVTSLEMHLNQQHNDAKLEGETLKIYLSSKGDYRDGSVTIYTTQFDGDYYIKSFGKLKVAETIVKLKINQIGLFVDSKI